MKRIFLLAWLLFAANAYGQSGYLSRPDCDSLTAPIDDQTVCLQTTTADGRTAGHIYIRRSGAWVDVDGSGGAPTTSTYITQTADGTLSNEQALGSLATGVLKNTTTTGVLSIATEGTDYYKPGGTDVAVTDGGTGRSTLTNHGVVIGAGTSGVNVTGTGTTGQVLTSNGASADPTFQSVTGTGTVTSVATTSPITGGPITDSGTIACPTCTTAASALTANQLVTGGGSQALGTVGSLGTSTQVLHGNASGSPTWGAVGLTTDVTGTLPVASGGTNLTAAADDNVMIGNGTTWQTKALPDCDDTGGNHLNYDTTTNVISCGTSGGGAGSVAFSGITGATNTTAAMVVGTGASLAVSGSGTIAATTSADAIAHIADAADAHAGTAITNTPAGNIAATTVQAAIDELDTEKLGVGANAVTATALASNPTDCAAGAYANAIAASGNLTCEILIVTSTADPTGDDDTGDGYIIGTKWINTTDSKVFEAKDVTAAAAVWLQVYPAVEADTDQTVFTRGTGVTTGVNEGKPKVLYDADPDTALVMRITSGGVPEYNTKCGGVVGGCDRVLTHNAGKKTQFKDSDGNVEVEYTEDVGFSKLTTASEAQGDILYRNGTAWTVLPAGTNGQVLQTQGAAANPQWATPVTTSSTDTFTNKTLDAEGTGNSITIPRRLWFPFAACQNTTATLIWDSPPANAPAAACNTGSNTQKGVADFDATTDESLHMTYLLPTTWTGAIDARIRWHAAATSGAVGWCVQLVSVADGETGDPAFPAQGAGNCVSDTAKGTTLQENDATITGVTATGVAAGELLYIRVSRDANGGAVTDDMSGDARGIGLELTIREAL